MVRWVVRILMGVSLALALLYAVDWSTWRARMARGNGLDEVTVTRMSVASLKRDKEEYYFDGEITVPCARSLLPPLTEQGWMTPCWYLRRHRAVVTHY